MKECYFPISEEGFEQTVLPLIVHFQNRPGRPTKISHDVFFCAILYVLRTGVSWRDVPPIFGSLDKVQALERERPFLAHTL